MSPDEVRLPAEAESRQEPAGVQSAIVAAPSDTALLDEIRDLQNAFGAVLDGPLAPDDAAEAARRLLARARAHPIAEMAVPALQWVLERHLEELVAGGYGDRIERRVMDLRRAGATTCTRCLLPLPDPDTIRYWQRERYLASAWRDRMRGVAS